MADNLRAWADIESDLKRQGATDAQRAQARARYDQVAGGLKAGKPVAGPAAPAAPAADTGESALGGFARGAAGEVGRAVRGIERPFEAAGARAQAVVTPAVRHRAAQALMALGVSKPTAKAEAKTMGAATGGLTNAMISYVPAMVASHVLPGGKAIPKSATLAKRALGWIPRTAAIGAGYSATRRVAQVGSGEKPTPTPEELGRETAEGAAGFVEAEAAAKALGKVLGTVGRYGMRKLGFGTEASGGIGTGAGSSTGAGRDTAARGEDAGKTTPGKGEGAEAPDDTPPTHHQTEASGTQDAPLNERTDKPGSGAGAPAAGGGRRGVVPARTVPNAVAPDATQSEAVPESETGGQGSSQQKPETVGELVRRRAEEAKPGEPVGPPRPTERVGPVGRMIRERDAALRQVDEVTKRARDALAQMRRPAARVLPAAGPEDVASLAGQLRGQGPRVLPPASRENVADLVERLRQPQEPYGPGSVLDDALEPEPEAPAPRAPVKPEAPAKPTRPVTPDPFEQQPFEGPDAITGELPPELPEDVGPEPPSADEEDQGPGPPPIPETKPVGRTLPLAEQLQAVESSIREGERRMREATSRLDRDQYRAEVTRARAALKAIREEMGLGPTTRPKPAAPSRRGGRGSEKAAGQEPDESVGKSPTATPVLSPEPTDRTAAGPVTPAPSPAPAPPAKPAAPPWAPFHERFPVGQEVEFVHPETGKRTRGTVVHHPSDAGAAQVGLEDGSRIYVTDDHNVRRVEAKDEDVFAVPPRTGESVPARGAHTTVRAEGHKPVMARYEVAELGDLVASHDADLNPDARHLPGLQGRARDRAAYKAQIQRMRTDLDPDRLGASPSAIEGAPVVGPDDQVEGGNGRVIALKGLEPGSENLSRYHDWLQDHAADFGIDPDALHPFENPVLIRRRLTEMSHAERVKWADATNVAPSAALGPAEQAQADARRITPAMLDKLEVSARGDLNTVGNMPFIRGFMGELAPAEANDLVTREGFLSDKGLRRVTQAVVAKAYAEPGQPLHPALERMFESADSNVKTVQGGLLRAAPTYARYRAAVEAGERVWVDAMTPLLDGAATLADLRSRGFKIQDWLNQADFFENPTLTRVMELYNRYGNMDDLADALGRIGDGLNELPNPKQRTLLGEPLRTPTPREIFETYLSDEGLFAEHTREQEAIAKTVRDLNAEIRTARIDGDFAKAERLELQRDLLQKKPERPC